MDLKVCPVHRFPLTFLHWESNYDSRLWEREPAVMGLLGGDFMYLHLVPIQSGYGVGSGGTP